MTFGGKLRITEIDFDQIKVNLKNFLRSQDEFKDFDFEGSGIAIILDILAYNTVYLAFYANQVASEMFLDTAILRESVVSRAKAIGYTPTSKRSSTAVVDIQINPIDSPANILIPKDTRFSTRINNITYIFRTTQAINVSPDGSGNYIAEGVELKEGIDLTHRFTVDTTGDQRQRYVIPNDCVDTSQLQVKVQISETDTTQQFFTLATDINEITPDDPIYFLQEVEDKRFEIIFGDGVIGRAIEDGNIIVVDYVTTKGTAPNKANTFEPIQKLHLTGTSVTTTVLAAFGGADEETIESIRKLAPLSYSAQNRAVTASDYEILIKKDFPQVESVRVWGGEEALPPQYGRVFASLKPVDGLELSDASKQTIIDQIIRPRSVISTEVLIVDPEFIFIVPSTIVRYTANETTKSADQIKNDVIQTVNAFADSELNQFDAFFRYSRFTDSIDDTDLSVKSNLTNIKIKQKLEPTLFTAQRYMLNFNNPLNKGDVNNSVSTIESSVFTFLGGDAFFGDDGKGNLFIFRKVQDNKIIIKSEGVGTVDYDTGMIDILSFVPEGLPTGVTTIDIIATPLKNDIFPEREQILIIDEPDIAVTVLDESVEAEFVRPDC